MPLAVTLFSDFTCPYSLVTEASLRARAGADPELAITYRAFELFPAPAPPVPPGREPGLREMAAAAAALGLALRDPGFRPRTRKAHEAARFAAAHGAEPPFREAVLEAYWSEGRDVGRIDVLADLAPAAGLDPLDLRIALDIDLHADAVERDERLAARLNVPGVPALFLGTGPGARVLLGAQTPATLDAALRAL